MSNDIAQCLAVPHDLPVEHGVGDTERVGPVAQWLRHSVMGSEARISPVGVLHSPRGPSAIVRRIRTVVVDAVDRVRPRRAGAHIPEEGAERGRPFWTHGNAAAAVATVMLVRGVQAPNDDATPGSIFGRTAVGATLPRVTVDQVRFPSSIALQTSTGPRVAAFECAGCAAQLSSTGADTQILMFSLRAAFVQMFTNRQASEYGFDRDWRQRSHRCDHFTGCQCLVDMDEGTA